MIKIFIVEDDDFCGQLIKGKLQSNDNYEVSWFRTGAELLSNLNLEPDIISIDYNLPEFTGIELLEKIKDHNSEISTVVVSGQDKLDVVIETYEKGASGYIMKDENMMVNLEKAIENLAKKVSLVKEVAELKAQILDRNKYNEIIGESAAIMSTLKLIQRVENSKILTLITGESGTGKELVARALHFNSERRKRPFIPVNVAAIPEDLIESELFGHEKGAFTGASSKRIGKFEEANKGTIFLDEIGEMDMSLQTKLLRVLQEGKVVRIGSNKEIELDMRVVAATNKNLLELVEKGEFREDLYYRLQGFLIHLPPLRERENDVVVLSKYFLKQFCDKSEIENKNISNSAIAKLMNHNWPGNVRELKSVVERAVLVCDSDEITDDDIILPQQYSKVRVA